MTLKGFYEYTTDELRNTLPKNVYQLKVRETTVDEWDDGRPKLNISTVVVGGAFDGKFGPRHTWSLGDSDGVAKDGREFHVDGVEEAKKLIRDVRAIRDGKEVVLSSPGEYDDRMLTEIGKQIIGDSFVASVSEDGNGYPKIRGRIYAMSAPPKTFKGEGAAKAFDLSNV